MLTEVRDQKSEVRKKLVGDRLSPYPTPHDFILRAGGGPIVLHLQVSESSGEMGSPPARGMKIIVCDSVRITTVLPTDLDKAS
jgi:hypothetical protein